MRAEDAMSHNPYTGNPVTRSGSNSFTDSVTSQTVYINPAPTAIALISDGQGRILLALRKYDPHQGKWDLPGGFVEAGESLEDALRREIKEELDIEVTDVRYFMSGVNEYLDEGIQLSLIDCVFTAKLLNTEQTVTVADDVADYKWVSQEQVNFNEIAPNAIQLYIKEYFKLT